MALVSRWMGTDLRYTVVYPDDFGITDVATELKNAQAVLDMQLTNKIKVEVAKQVLAAYVPELPADRFDAIIADIEKQGTEPAYNETPYNPAPSEAPNPEGGPGEE